MNPCFIHFKCLIRINVLVATLVCLYFNSFAQDTCRVYLNQQILLTKTSWDDNNSNKVSIKPNLKKKETLNIYYNTVLPAKNWQRFILLTDDNDQTIFSKVFDFSSGKYVLTAKELEAASKKAQKLFLYTYAFPKDPAEAAAIRIRRLMICQLLLN
jgi:hypothetical protein